MADILRGIFPALQATFDSSGEIDIPSMESQVSHCIEKGTHGLVFPVMGGELFYLSESERKTLIEVVVRTAAGQVPVVAGVAAPSTPTAAVFARYARSIGADAVVALPPYIAHANLDEKRVYYQTIANNAQIPVMIQHSWAGMSGEFMASLIRENDHISYVKEEAAPSGHSITSAIEAAGDACLGVFGGAHGKWMIPEMRRGAAGFIPAAQTTEVYVAIWDAYQQGDEAKAREIFALLSPFLDLLSLIGLRLCKDVLVRRGIIKTATMRIPNSRMMDAYDQYELDYAMGLLEPIMMD
jgi:4-hydroxy-tetrahydrodipicolinate synthase